LKAEEGIQEPQRYTD